MQEGVELPSAMGGARRVGLAQPIVQPFTHYLPFIHPFSRRDFTYCNRLAKKTIELHVDLMGDYPHIKCTFQLMW